MGLLNVIREKLSKKAKKEVEIKWKIVITNFMKNATKPLITVNKQGNFLITFRKYGTDILMNKNFIIDKKNANESKISATLAKIYDVGTMPLFMSYKEKNVVGFYTYNKILCQRNFEIVDSNFDDLSEDVYSKINNLEKEEELDKILMNEYNKIRIF